MHPQNPFKQPYDFERLIQLVPALAEKVADNGHGRLSINFADRASVKLLNQALLKDQAGLAFWDIPEHQLIPPVPGRADYLCHLKDLLTEQSDLNGKLLDIGCGANLIYPLLASKLFGCKVVASEIDQNSLQTAKMLVQLNGLQKQIQLRHQRQKDQVFKGIVKPGEQFAACICNPPFYQSAEHALAVNQQKTQNLQVHQKKRGKSSVQVIQPNNFSGTDNELWCEGGERQFVLNMITESRNYSAQFGWFTSLVSQKDNLNFLQAELKKLKAEVRVIGMEQGQKISRLLAWRF